MSSSATYQCHPCKRHFGSQKALNNHVGSTGHSQTLQRFRCPYCERGFATQAALAQHAASPAHAAPGPAGEFTLERPAESSSSWTREEVEVPAHQIWAGMASLQAPRRVSAPKKQYATPSDETPRLIFVEDTISQAPRPQRSSIADAAFVHRPRAVEEPDRVNRSSTRSGSVASHQLADGEGVSLSSSNNGLRNIPATNKAVLNSEEGHNWISLLPSQHQNAILELAGHCHSEGLLRNKGYQVDPYSDEHIDGLSKCQKCDVMRKKVKFGSTQCVYHRIKRKDRYSKLFVCCGSADGAGCVKTDTHHFIYPSYASMLRAFEPTPGYVSGVPKLRAVVLDCEMVGTRSGRGQVIQLCAVEYCTGIILIDKLVSPDEEVMGWRSSVHGITRTMMQEASAQGQVLNGWREARAELWKYIDNETILIGHALQHDLQVLGIIHSRIVDSGILTARLVGAGTRQWGLQTLALDFLNLGMRQNKGGVHSCLEDVMMTREVVVWCMQNEDDLAAWARRQTEEEARKTAEREKKKKDAERAEKPDGSKSADQQKKARVRSKRLSQYAFEGIIPG